MTITLSHIDDYATGGPHEEFHNDGSEPVAVVDHLRRPVGIVQPGERALLFIREDAGGNRTPVLFGGGAQ